jgi:rod shape-determining protein MreC
VYDRKTVRRRQAVLFGCVALSVVLLTAYFGNSGGGGVTGTVQRGAQELFSPIQSGASKALKPFRDLVGWTGDVFDAKDENERLKRDLDSARSEAAQAQTMQRDNEQLRALVGLPKTQDFPDEIDRTTARVIGHSPSLWYSAVQIDKGTGDGIEVDQPVVTGEGLAGKVTEVTGGTARVTLITNDSSSVSAEIIPQGLGGVVSPRVGDPEDLLLEFVEKGRRPRKGATVVTSGSTSNRFESLFPRGIPIGRVTKVEEGDLELYRRVHIEPLADLRRINYVQVLNTDPPGDRAEVPSP